MIFLFTSDQYEMLYIYFFSHYSPPPKKKILLEHVSMHMIKCYFQNKININILT